jgi:crotonobetaine/carnitine-CoA ligase
MTEAPLPPLPELAERHFGRALAAAAHDQPNKTALVFPKADVSFTFSELLAGGQRIAGGYRAAGIDRGGRVGIMLANRPEYVLAWYGCVFSGTVDVAIHHGMVGDILVHEMTVAQVEAVVCDAHGLDALRAVMHRLPALRLVIAIGRVDARDVPVPIIAFERLGDGDPLDDRAAPTDISSIRYTSGTTGPAKAVGLTMSHMTTFAHNVNWITGMGPNDRVYTAFPLHHSFASVLGVAGAIEQQATCIVDTAFSASRYLSNLRELGATIGHILPPQIPMLEVQPATPQDLEHDCRVLFTAFTNPEFEERFGVRLIQNYAMTEGGSIAFMPPGEPNRPGSLGRTNPIFELRIVDEEDQPVPAGTEGEIVWRPKVPHVMMDSYVGDPGATVAAWRGLWFHTSDRGRLDEDGFLYFFGRTGEQIRRKGVNIAAYHIEEAARQLPGVVEAVAIPVPSEVGESEIKLCIEVDGTTQLDAAEVHAALHDHLPKEMVPRYLEFRDSLPRTPTFKISRRDLQEEGESGITPATIDMDRGRATRPAP